METVDLSKPNLCTVCVLLLAPQQVRLKPRRNKTHWVCAFPPQIFPRTGLQGKDHCAPPRPLFWAVSIPAPKFYCFLKAFDLPDMIALNFAVRSGIEIRSDPCECFSLTTEENPPRLTIGQRRVGIHAFTASQERGYLMIHLVSKYISTGSQVSCRW